MGKRVTLHYEEKVGLPTSCFGETRHFVNNVTVSEEIPLAAGVMVPTHAASAAASAASATGRRALESTPGCARVDSPRSRGRRRRRRPRRRCQRASSPNFGPIFITPLQRTAVTPSARTRPRANTIARVTVSTSHSPSTQAPSGTGAM